MDKEKLVFRLKSEAARLGFDQVGIATAVRLDKEAAQLEEWLNKGNHGTMSWMENHFEKRVDPTQLVPGAKSVISLMYNYYTDVEQTDPAAPKISRYAYGNDYHQVIKQKLKNLIHWLRDEVGEINGRCFVDSAPVMERQWAEKSGLGWLGKNTLLIHPKKGSYFFLAELIIDLDLPADHPIKDHCGTCRRCIDACPTNAFSEEGYVLDSTKCISYLTIELKDAIPEEFKGKMANWAFGCDICQEVCPWNRFSKKHSEPEFEPHPELINMTKKEWQEITQEVFVKLFKDSAIQRTRFDGLKRNIQFIKE